MLHLLIIRVSVYFISSQSIEEVSIVIILTGNLLSRLLLILILCIFNLDVTIIFPWLFLSLTIKLQSIRRIANCCSRLRTALTYPNLLSLISLKVIINTFVFFTAQTREISSSWKGLLHYIISLVTLSFLRNWHFKFFFYSTSRREEKGTRRFVCLCVVLDNNMFLWSLW